MSKEAVDNKYICELIREAETAFTSGGGTLTSKYVTTDLYEDISTIYAYLESKHISGETDNLGRDKPFFNIVVANRNIYYRATDLDRKDINVKPTSISTTMASFLATVHIQEWMRRENFGAFLNSWGIDLAGFNSCVVKFVESGGQLHSMVVPWSRLIVDPVNFDDNPKIELLELTEAQLYKRKGYDKDMIEKLCDALAARETTDKQQKDSKPNYIKLYEIHGNLPLSYLTGKEADEDQYVQQMHVVSFVASKEEGKFDDFTLYSGKEEQDPYMLTSLLPATDGSISLNGSVKTLFQAQWMLNHSVKSIKDRLDVGDKLIFQTADSNFVGRNVLNAIESGDILIHADNKPLTVVNTANSEITAQQSFGNMWKGLAGEIVGVSDAMRTGDAKAGAAWHQVEALLAESHSLFELMTENKALALEQMLRRFVIPFIKKQMDSKDEVMATLEHHNIMKIDSMYVPREAIRRYNTQTKKDIFANIDALSNGGEVTPIQPFDQAQQEASVQQSLSSLGNQRSFVPTIIDENGKEVQVSWAKVFEDLEWELEVDITEEQKDTKNLLTTLSTMLQVVMNPGYAGNKQAQAIVGKILQEANVMSQLELATMPAPSLPPQPAAPVGAPGGAAVAA